MKLLLQNTQDHTHSFTHTHAHTHADRQPADWVGEGKEHDEGEQ